MYDLTPLYRAGSDGTGQGLAIVGQSFVDTSNSSKIATFQLDTGLAVNPGTAVLVPGSGVQAISPGDQGESEIDLEYSSGIAPHSAIFLVYVGANSNYSVFDALTYAIDEKIAPVISISYGICESLMSPTDLDQENSLFEQASAQGQTLVAAAGDSGSTACASYTTAEGVPLTTQQALSISFPADSPYVTAVGGTQMSAGTFAAGSSPYWANGLSTIGSLLSYVPEVVWNEDSVSFGIASGGGGASAHFTRPTWQSGVPGIPSGAFRLVPDLALQSSIANPGFLACSSDPTLAGTQSCTIGLQNSNNRYTVAGGTSFATPIFAGFLAILNQIEQTNGLGNINPELYTLASNSNQFASAFHDILSGTNACIQGIGNCAPAGQAGYAATPGYDEATGLGSIDFGNLVKALPQSVTPNLLPTNIAILNPQLVANPGASVSIELEVESSASSPSAPFYPSVGVTISLDGSPLEASVDVSTSHSFIFTAPSTAGTHLLVITYPGDPTHFPSTATVAVLVGSATATGSFTVTASNLTVANGSTGNTPISATSTAGYSGRVAWSLSAASSAGAAELCYSIGQPTTTNVNAVTLTIGVGTACNSASPAARPSLRPLTFHAAAKQEPTSPWRKASGVALYAGLLLCSSLAGWRRKARLPILLPLALLMLASFSLAGCGGSSNSGSGSTTPPATPPPATTSNYTLTLTGTDSVNTSITASTSFTLTVK